jgi:hypothetical protein
MQLPYIALQDMDRSKKYQCRSFFQNYPVLTFQSPIFVTMQDAKNTMTPVIHVPT